MAGNCERLLEDPDYQGMLRTGLELRDKINELLENRGTTINTLQQLKTEVEKTYDNTRKVGIVGTVFSILGIVLLITSTVIVTSLIFALELSLDVIIATELVIISLSLIFTSLGMLVSTGSDIFYWKSSKIKLNAAQTVCATDQERMTEADDLQQRFRSSLENLSMRHNVSIPELLTISSNSSQVGEIAYGAYRGIDAIADVSREISSALMSATPVTHSVWVGILIAVRICAAVGVVCNTCCLPVEICIMIKSSYDVYKYKKKRESNSKIAQTIGQLLTQVQVNEAELREFQHEATSNQHDVCARVVTEHELTI